MQLSPHNVETEESTCYIRKGFDEEVKVYWSWEYDPGQKGSYWVEPLPGRLDISIDRVMAGKIDPETGFLAEPRTDVTKRILKNKKVMEYLIEQCESELNQRD